MGELFPHMYRLISRGSDNSSGSDFLRFWSHVKYYMIWLQKDKSADLEADLYAQVFLYRFNRVDGVDYPWAVRQLDMISGVATSRLLFPIPCTELCIGYV